MSTTIYVVEGWTGEWSDRTEWLVRAFTSEERAKGLVISASARAREIQQWIANDGDPYEEEGRPTSKFDPTYWDHGGCTDERNYHVLTVELES